MFIYLTIFSYQIQYQCISNSNKVFPRENVLTRAQLMCTTPVVFMVIIVNTLDIG